MGAVKIQKHEDVGIRSLRDLTKEELIYCIEHTMQSNSSARYWFERYVLHVADSRREKKFGEEKVKGDKWINLQKEYAELLKPHRGKTIGELPPDVIQKGAVLEREIKKAQAAYFATFDYSDR